MRRQDLTHSEYVAMNKRWIGTLMAGAMAAWVALPALAAPAPKTMLEPGAMAPDFTLPATLAGHDYAFALKQAPTILPGDPLCEAHSYWQAWPS